MVGDCILLIIVCPSILFKTPLICSIFYNNKNSIGYLNGDIITVYGKYKKMSGNKPIIYAKYINIKK